MIDPSSSEYGRPFPADDLTCQTLAALRHPAARNRMRELAIGPEAFDWSPERVLAAAMMAERSFTSEELALLERDDGRHATWRTVVTRSMEQDAAVRAVNRFAALRVRWWFPRWLAWVADGIAGGQPLAWADEELVWLRNQLAPVIQQESRP